MGAIRHRRSTTSGAIPTAATLVTGELAINVADGNVFTELSSGSVVRIAGYRHTVTSYTGSLSVDIVLPDRYGHIVQLIPTTFIAPSSYIGTGVWVDIPNDSTLNMPVGVSIEFIQTAAGDAWFEPASGVSLFATPGVYLRTVFSVAKLTKIAANVWMLQGDLKTP